MQATPNGTPGGWLAEPDDIANRVPAARTDRVQELHVQCYHALCEALEGEFFGREALGTESTWRIVRKAAA